MATTNKEQVRGKKYRKFGRNGRPKKHHLGQQCGLRHCGNLLASRKWSAALDCYVPSNFRSSVGNVPSMT